MLNSVLLVTVALLIVAILLVALIVAIISSVQRASMHYFFALFLAAATTWITGIAIFLATNHPQVATLAAACYYSAGAGIAYAFLMLGLTIPSRRNHEVRVPGVIIGLLAIPAALMVALAVTPHALVNMVDVTGRTQNIVELNVIGHVLYASIFVMYGIAASYLLIRHYIQAKEERYKRQLAYIVGSAVSGIAFGVVFNLLLPMFGNYYLIWVGPLYGIPVVILISYAMMRHKLFDVRSAVVRSVAYFLVLATMAVLYFSLAFLVSGFFHQSFNDPIGLTINMSIAIVLAFIFQPMKQFFDKLTSRIFYRDDYNTDDFFAHINRELSATTDLRSLLQRAATEIGKTVKAEQGFLLVRYGDRRFIMAGTKNHRRVLMSEIAQLDAYVADHGHATILTDMLIDTPEMESVLIKHQIAIILPLKMSDASVGYLFLGTPRSRNYTRRDIRLLETISDELVIAIQNALSIQDVEEINQTLQQRIEDATKELRRTNAQLQRLDTAKDEFISMASHQLRTPLTSVKGYISMVLEGDAGKITDMQHKLLSEAFVSSERMVHLISDFLNVSRLQTGKFMLEQHAVDLAKVAAQEVDGLQAIAKSHDLKLKFKAGARTPILYIDEGKIRQVIMNFIDNAIYYSREFTTITISVSVEAGDVLLQVQDTGIGVPANEQLHLFTKFFRATNAQKQRPDGTGVGLFLAKKVVAAHGGSVVFHSVEGEGSMFGFRLPIKKLQSAPAHQADDL
jgi:signal transduction histidine kinase